MMEKCAECGMPLASPAEFHPYAACRLFQQTGQADKVDSAMEYIATHHPVAKRRQALLREAEGTLDHLLGCANAIVGADPYDQHAQEAFEMFDDARKNTRATLARIRAVLGED